MPFKIISIPLTEEQLAAIKRGVGEDAEGYCLLAEPKMNMEVLHVQVATRAQYEIMRPAILKAHELPQWRSKRKKGK